MDTFANKPDAERRDILQEAANRRDVSPIIVEKDFWVCWTLKRLFSNPTLAPYLTFKGGTSLSKAYGLIERFSEDIDLTIGRDAPFIKDGKSPMEAGISGKERERRIDELKQNAQRFVADSILPSLAEDIQAALAKTEGWQLVVDENDKDRQTIFFHYPRVFGYTKEIRFLNQKQQKIDFHNDKSEKIDFHSKGYIAPSIKLEFGARGETEPSAPQSIRPYVAETFPDFFTAAKVDVPTLAAERTFWEKVTILHSLYHGTKLLSRMSRHYYDTFAMTQKGVADEALKNTALLDQVVRNKSLLFRDAKASYGTAKIGSLCLIPPEPLMTVLQKDYEAMGEMFMGDFPEFEAMMSELAKLEHRLNAKAA
jgi:hypothetical protein